MISFSAFRSVRARLLALMALIVLPIAVFSIVLASANYHSVMRGIEAAQVRMTSDYASRSRLWFRGVVRSLVTAEIAAGVAQANGQDCNAPLKSMLSRISGFQAIHVRLSDGKSCIASARPDITEAGLIAVLDDQRSKPALRSWVGTNPADSRFDSVMVGNALHISVYVKSRTVGGQSSDTILLVDPVLIDQAFQLGSTVRIGIAALMHRGSQIIIANGTDETDEAWLPTDEVVGEKMQIRVAQSRSGTRAVYGSIMVADPDVYVLTRFDNDTAQAAWMQFLVLCVTPLLTLLLLFVAYARAIQSKVIHWIAGIERAARASRTDRSTVQLAPVGATMPDDIKSVAVAFNDMVSEASRREAVLTNALNSNRDLMRELHHRVKNSLQVILSYLALSRRQKSGPESADLAETEAKVQVLSSAYRLALTDGGMRPVSVRPFAEEIIGNLSSGLRKPHQWISSTVEIDAGLVVDRIIPFGLALVEAVIAGLKAEGAISLSIRVQSLDDGWVEMVVSTDGVTSPGIPNPRIMAGLAAQLNAVMQPAEPQIILRWRFAP